MQWIPRSDETKLFVMTHSSMDVLHNHNIALRKPGAGEYILYFHLHKVKY